MASKRNDVIHTRHASAWIETVPTEIIQIIHIYALEPNFARASAVIAKVVSRKFFYDIFLIHAFWYDPHEIFQAEGQSHSCLLPPWYQRLSFDEQCRLQDQVIHCRWFTAQRFQKTMQSLFDLTSRSISCTGSYVNMELLSAPLMAMQSWRELLGHEPSLRWPERRDVTPTWEKSLRIPAARLFTIPNKLLRGPWSCGVAQNPWPGNHICPDRHSIWMNVIRVLRMLSQRIGIYVFTICFGFCGSWVQQGNRSVFQKVSFATPSATTHVALPTCGH